MKEQIEKLLDELADKTLKLGCRYLYKNEFRTFCDSDHFKNAEVVVREKIDVKNIKIIGHPVLIGDVLEKIVNLTTTAKYPKEICEEMRKKDEHMLELINLWGACFSEDEPEEKTGLSKSLSQIIEESGWEVMEGTCSAAKALDWPIDCACGDKQRLKSPEARALFDYLLKIFNK